MEFGSKAIAVGTPIASGDTKGASTGETGKDMLDKSGCGNPPVGRAAIDGFESSRDNDAEAIGVSEKSASYRSRTSGSNG